MEPIDDSDLENAMEDTNSTNLSTLEKKLKEKNQQLKKVCIILLSTNVNTT